jgi:hypothetical protein
MPLTNLFVKAVSALFPSVAYSYNDRGGQNSSVAAARIHFVRGVPRKVTEPASASAPSALRTSGTNA